jgi:hypothetical protein
MVGNATFTIVRSMIVMKYATANTANARQRCTSVFDSVFIATSFTSLVACRRVDPPCLEVVIRQTAGIHRLQNVFRSSLRRQLLERAQWLALRRESCDPAGGGGSCNEGGCGRGQRGDECAGAGVEDVASGPPARYLVD